LIFSLIYILVLLFYTIKLIFSTQSSINELILSAKIKKSSTLLKMLDSLEKYFSIRTENLPTN